MSHKIERVKRWIDMGDVQRITCHKHGQVAICWTEQGFTTNGTERRRQVTMCSLCSVSGKSKKYKEMEEFYDGSWFVRD